MEQTSEVEGAVAYNWLSQMLQGSQSTKLAQRLESGPQEGEGKED